jgi:UDP-N-acetyl-D-glucosamine dehydrogenase
MKSVNYNARFIELASEINTGMPRYVVSKVQDALNEHRKAIKGSKVLVLGAAYKPDIDDLRESPALDVIHLLTEKGADVSYHDPYCPSLRTHEGATMESVPNLMAAVRAADCAVIITNHSSYDYEAILDAAALIVDTRNALGKGGRAHEKVFSL